jgi:predicted GTPase
MLSPVHDLEAHRRLAAAATQELRAISRAAGRLGVPEIAQRCDELVERAEQEVFRVAVVGEFKRGKSTLINALLGQEVLPSDVLPCSATLNRVVYGLQPLVRLRMRSEGDGARRDEIIGIDDLVDYVTKLSPEAEQRAAQIEEAVVSFPSKYCRDKAEIIDTPGLNDDGAMTAVTLSVLPTVDAAILVILAQSPFSATEASFLQQLMSHDLGRVLFVVNRMDEVRRPRDRERVLSVVTDRIRAAIAARAAELHGEGSAEAVAFIERAGAPKVFGLSGGQALDAKLEHDPAGLEASGFLAFEAALERFLSIERGLVGLWVQTEVAASGAAKLLAQIHLRRGALRLEHAGFEAAYAETRAELAGLRERLDAESKRLATAADELRARLRPRARQLPEQLREAALQAIDAAPISSDDLGRGRADETRRRLIAQANDRMATLMRVETERIQAEIDAAVNEEVRRLVAFGERLADELGDIELRFIQNTDQRDTMLDGATAGAGAVAGAVAGGIWGGVLAGALSGYQVAGVKGAATGAAAGVATSLTAGFAGLTVAALIGLPLTWPVVLPTLALAGLASTFGARWATGWIFSGERIQQLRDEVRAQLDQQLQSTAADRARSLSAGVDRQIDEVYGALRAQLQNELGGPIDSTQRSLDALRLQSTRSAASSEAEIHEINQLEAQLQGISAAAHRRGAELRALLPSAAPAEV